MGSGAGPGSICPFQRIKRTVNVPFELPEAAMTASELAERSRVPGPQVYQGILDLSGPRQARGQGRSSSMTPRDGDVGRIRE